MPARKSDVRRNLLLLLAGAIALPSAMAQQVASAASDTTAPYTPTLTFDVATIRETKPDGNTGFMISFANPPNSSTFHFTNVRGWQLVTAAYGIDDYKLFGNPDWIKNTMYEVNAKSDQTAEDKLSKLTSAQGRLEKQHMLQALLADRFHLKAHWETRELPTLALVVGKNGLKLQEAKNTPPTPEEIKRFGDHPLPPTYENCNRSGCKFVAHGASIDSVVSIVSSDLQKDMLDRTALTGKYDFILQFSGTRETNKGENAKDWPPLEDAVEDQLGLKIEPTKGPVQVLIIDHIEKPTDN